MTFHLHHHILLEYCYDYDERVRFIKREKPKEEQKLRLRLFKLIPTDRCPQGGWKAYSEAGEAFYGRGRACYNKWDAYNKAAVVYYKANHEALDKLHEELCPNCPWDGESIFRNEKV